MAYTTKENYARNELIKAGRSYIFDKVKLMNNYAYWAKDATGQKSSQVMYVDVNRSNTGSGTPGEPYATMQAAVDAIATAADNSDTLGYVIYVAPGTYTETLTLESDALYNLAFIAEGGPHGVIMDPATDDALESEVDNTNLHYLYFKGFNFKGNIDFDGELNDTKFLYNDCVFEDCTFNDAAESITINVQNANRFWWKNGAIHILTTVAFTNVVSAGFSGESYRDLFPITGAPGTTTLTANSGNSKVPYGMADAHGGGDQATLWYKDVFCQRREPTITSTAGTARLYVVNSYCGLAMGLTIPTGSHFYAFNSVFPGAVTWSDGSTAFWYNSVAVGTLTDGATQSTFYGDDTAAG